MNMHKLIIQILLAGAVGAASQSAHAQLRPAGPHEHQDFAPPHPPGPPMDDGAPPFLRMLDLSEVQDEAVFKILHAQVPVLRDQQRVIEKTHAALHALALANSFDDKAASALARDAGQAMVALTLQQARTEASIVALLTPEQRARLGDARGPRPSRP